MSELYETYQTSKNDIIVGLNIIHRNGIVAYCDPKDKRIHTMNVASPWEVWKCESQEDEIIFERYLMHLQKIFIEYEIGTIRKATIAIPYSFSYREYKRICEIGRRQGIRILRMECAGVYNILGRNRGCIENKKPIYEIICTVEEFFLEFSVVKYEDCILELLGTTEVRLNDIWQNVDQNRLERNIQLELKQFLKELGMESVCNTNANNVKISLCGQVPVFLKNFFFQFFKNSIDIYGSDSMKNTAIGCLLYGAKLTGGPVFINSLIISSTARNYWISLGAEGERAIVIPRFTEFPTKKSVKLLVSTQTQLRIYEGNYQNERYDTLLDVIELSHLDIKEGTEINCRLEIDSNHEIYIIIENHNGNVIVDRVL